MIRAHTVDRIRIRNGPVGRSTCIISGILKSERRQWDEVEREEQGGGLNSGNDGTGGKRMDALNRPMNSVEEGP
jgi:hypothetical protein